MITILKWRDGCFSPPNSAKLADGIWERPFSTQKRYHILYTRIKEINIIFQSKKERNPLQWRKSGPQEGNN